MTVKKRSLRARLLWCAQCEETHSAFPGHGRCLFCDSPLEGKLPAGATRVEQAELAGFRARWEAYEER